MEPRFRGCRAVLARSFARIHETNLKKQGVLPLTFADPGDYDLIGERARISVMGLDDLTPGGSVRGVIDHRDDRPRDLPAEPGHEQPHHPRPDHHDPVTSRGSAVPDALVARVV